MKKILLLIKVILIVYFFYFSFKRVHSMFLTPRLERFKIAEQSQGTCISQNLLDILIFQYPDYSDAYFEKSVAFNKRGDYEKGFELLNKAVELDCKLHLGYRGWVKLMKLKDYQGSINDLKRLDSLTPNTVDAPWGDNIHYLQGLAYKGLKEYDLSIEQFDKSVNPQKDSSWVNHNLYLYKGIILKEQNRYEEALNHFNTCLKYCYYKSPEAYYHKGTTYIKLNLLDSSKACLEKSLILFKEGYAHKDKYNEVQDELYLSDIEDRLNEIAL